MRSTAPFGRCRQTHFILTSPHSGGQRSRGQKGISSPTNAPRPSRRIGQVRAKLRRLHDAIRIEEVYIEWIHRGILFHHERYPCEMGAIGIEALLTQLAVRGKVAASTRNRALASLLCLDQRFATRNLSRPRPSAQTPETFPAVRSTDEGRDVLDRMPDVPRMPAERMDGSGLPTAPNRPAQGKKCRPRSRAGTETRFASSRSPGGSKARSAPSRNACRDGFTRSDRS